MVQIDVPLPFCFAFSNESVSFLWSSKIFTFLAHYFVFRWVE